MATRRLVGLLLISMALVRPLAGGEKANSTWLKGPEIRVKVEGMKCDGCVTKVEAALKKLSGVASIEINVKTGQVRLGLKKDASVRKREIERAIQDAGFTARAISSPPPGVQIAVQGVTCEGCIDRLKAAIKESPCAEIASVNFNIREARLKCSGDQTQRRQVIDRIKTLGFEVKEIPKKSKP